MTRLARVGAAGFAIALAAAFLSGCAPEPDLLWSPASWQATGSIVDSPPHETSDVQLTDFRVRNDDLGIDARWGRLAGEQPINAAIEQTVRDAVAASENARGVKYSPQAHPAGAGLGERGCSAGAMSTPAGELMAGRSGTVVVCEVVLARGNVFGEALRTVTAGDGAVTADTTTTFYTDFSTGAVGTGDALFGEVLPLWTSMIEVLRRDAGSLSLLPVASPTLEQVTVLQAALKNAVLAEGHVIIPVPAELTAVELEGLAAWSSAPEARPSFVSVEATGLTPLGDAIAHASGPFTGPAAMGMGWEHVPCDLVPCMAMTLDDGPSPLTPGFLDVLRDNHAAATFFMLGQEAQAYPDIVRRVAAEGHQIGNHTWNHPHLTTVPPETITDQISRTNAVLRELSGQPVATFRPPGGLLTKEGLALVGMPAIMWSVDTRDWAQPTDDDLRAYAIDTPEIGSIVLMHDIQDVTSRVFADVVSGLNDRGFVLVTIDQLFDGAVPSGVVRHGPPG